LRSERQEARGKRQETRDLPAAGRQEARGSIKFQVVSIKTLEKQEARDKRQEPRNKRQRAVRFSTAADCLGFFARERKKRQEGVSSSK
jgi:hypothetical protein